MQNVYKYEHVTHGKLATLDPSRTVVIATFGPLEVHGPHLPLAQDVFEAYAFAEGWAARVAAQRPDWNFLLLPPVPLGADALPQLGSVGIPPLLIREAAYRYLEPFAKAGYARLCYSSFHGGPRHVCALEDAADRLTRTYGIPAMSLFSGLLSRVGEGGEIYQRFLEKSGSQISAAQLKSDWHAGYIETSIGLHLWPNSIDSGWQDLPPRTLALEPGETEQRHMLLDDGGSHNFPGQVRRLVKTIRRVWKIFHHFKEYTYYGYPAFSSPEEGKAVFEEFLREGSEMLEEFIVKGRELPCHSPLWKFRWLLMSRLLAMAVK